MDDATWPTLGRDLAKMLVGAKIGFGSSRRVYEYELDKEIVIKEEGRYGSFQNIMEWEVWQAVKDTKYAKWFAPCITISGNGLLLLQKRVEPLPRAQYPKKIPAFFTDKKYQNFGMLGKQLVCFDYGTLHRYTLTQLAKKMQKADWWDEK